MDYLKYNEKYVSFEVAKKLHKLGYNELCDAFWTTNPKYGKEPLGLCITDSRHGYLPHSKTFQQDFLRVDEFLAPTWVDVLDWFETNYGLSGEVNKQAPYGDIITEPYWWYMIQDSKGKDISKWMNRHEKIMRECEQDVIGNYLNKDKFNNLIFEKEFAFKNRLDARKFVVNKILDIITLEK